MLHKTRGIVFKTTDYAESSVIAQIFTEKFGLQSYLINGVKKPKSKIRTNMLQPLHLLDMVVYHKPAGNMQRVAELRQLPVFHSIPYDVIKSSIVIFLNEILYKAIRQQTADDILFEFLYKSIELLDRVDGGLANFHLYFLLRLTKFLGFYPDRTTEGTNDYFDLQNGAFLKYPPTHQLVLHQPYTTYWTQLLKANFENLENIQIPVTERRILLNEIIHYYQLHIEGFGQIKSHRVLEDVLA
ncbi:MAG TPA: DNA repair protein RecO [Sphingobacteriaceae bacterium]|nr:DNA repair protein RecO [Sphingobacteriaceae bacterium]